MYAHTVNTRLSFLLPQESLGTRLLALFALGNQQFLCYFNVESGPFSYVISYVWTLSQHIKRVSHLHNLYPIIVVILYRMFYVMIDMSMPVGG